MKKLLIPSLFALSCALSQAATPIVLTGANADLIWEGGTAAATAFDIPNNYTYVGNNLNFGGTVGAPGIPQSFTSAADPAVEFSLLGAFNTNNALQLSQGQTGTLTLTTPASYSSLYLLTASAQGAGTGTVLITFADSSTLTLAYTSPDWYNTAVTPAFAASGTDGIRARTTDGAYFYSGAGKAPYLFSSTVSIPEAYQNLAINSLTFTVDSTGNANLSSAIFAISGDAVPEPSAAVLGTLGMLALIRRRRN